MATVNQIKSANATAIRNKTEKKSILKGNVADRLDAIADELATRGIINVADTTVLQTIEGVNTAKVLVKEIGLFEWKSTGIPDLVDIFPAAGAGAGVWQNVFPSGKKETFVETLQNLSSLKEKKGKPFNIVRTLGYQTAYDGGGNIYYWNSTSTAADDGGSVIQVTGEATGRYIALFETNEINPKQFGAKGDGVTNDLASMQAACNAAASTKKKILIAGDFNLNAGSLALPKDAVITFVGGKFINGTLVGDNNEFEVGQQFAFNNIQFTGVFKNNYISPCNFGAVPKNPTLSAIDSTNDKATVVFNKTVDNTAAIQAAFDSGFDVLFPAGCFYITSTIIIKSSLKVTLTGGNYGGVDRNSKILKNKDTVIHTDQAIVMFDIRAVILLDGGMFNVTEVVGPSNKVTVFSFDGNFYNWGSRFDTTILGNASPANGYNATGYLVDLDKGTGGVAGYVSYLEVDGFLQGLECGFKVNKYLKASTPERWCTQITLNFDTNGCKYAHYLESGMGYFIGGAHQKRHMLTLAENLTVAPTYISGASSIDLSNSYYWDYGSTTPSGGYYSSKYVLICNDLKNFNIYGYSFFNVTHIKLSESLIKELNAGNVIVDRESLSQEVGIVNPVAGILTKNWLTSGDLLDDRTDNYLYDYPFRFPSATVAAYNSAGTPVSNIVVDNASKPSILNGGTVTFQVGSDKDGYIEIDISNKYVTIGSFFGINQEKMPYVNNPAYSAQFKKIQLIHPTLGTTEVDTSGNYYGTKFKSTQYARVETEYGTGCKIRLVGICQLDGTPVSDINRFIRVDSIFLMLRQPVSFSSLTPYGTDQNVYKNLVMQAGFGVRYIHPVTGSTIEYARAHSSNTVPSPGFENMIWFDIRSASRGLTYQWNNNIYDCDGELHTVPRSGTTANRPTGVKVGFVYYDTTIGKPVWHRGSNVWSDATGNDYSAISNVTALYQPFTTQRISHIDTSAGNMTFAINPASLFSVYGTSAIVLTKITSDANTATVMPTSGTINGAASIRLTRQYDSVRVYSDGTNLFIAGYNARFANPVITEAVFSGNGSATSFNIPHGLPYTPKAIVQPGSADAAGILYVETNSTNIIVYYQTAPPTGTNNIKLNWSTY